MAYIKNFEKPETKHNRMSGGVTSNYDPLDNPTVTASNSSQQDFFNEHIKQYTDFISFCRWYPDLFLDLIRPKTGGINLHFDQRVFLRCICRFVSIYGVFPRGWRENVGRSNFYVYNCRFISRDYYVFNCSDKSKCC